jgi:hypothetical protein
MLKLGCVSDPQNEKMGIKETPVLPTNERQIRPLLTDLNNDSERLHVWNEVANSGEKKITAELVRCEVDATPSGLLGAV